MRSNERRERTSCFACSHGRAVHTCERKTMYVITQVYMRINILLARGRGYMECDDDNIIAPSSTLLSSSDITSHSFLSDVSGLWKEESSRTGLIYY